MAKRPHVGKCVHCTRDNLVRNWDHVLPESWYPEATLPDLEKWKIPSCIECNKELGKLEEELLAILAMCVDPNHPGSRGLFKKVLDSMDPKKARDERDRCARTKKQQRFIANSQNARQSLNNNGLAGIYPGLPKPSTQQIENGIPIFVPERLIKRICEKIVRGHVFLEDGHFIQPPFSVIFYPPNDVGAQPLIETIRMHGQFYERGDAIQISRATVHEEGFHALYKILIWRQFEMYAVVSDDYH